MAFGGAIKLQGESEYRAALKQIQNSLTLVGSEMAKVSSQFAKGEKSVRSLTAVNEVLTKKLTEQQKAYTAAGKMLAEAQSKYDESSKAVQTWEQKLEAAKKALEAAKSSTTASAEEIKKLENNVKECEQGLEKANTENEKYATTVQKWQTELNKAEAAVNKTTREIDDNEKAIDKAEKGLNEETSALDKNVSALKADGSAAEVAGEKQSGFAEKLGNVAKVLGTTMVAGAAAAGAAVISLTKQCVEGYAEYEQLVGGVETLFGTQGMSVEEYAKSVGKSVEEVKDKYSSLEAAQKTVLDNANNAFKTAGMSANEYIDTVTGFSASLISSLGGDTEKAAEYANRAIVDMSDNANKMGTDIASIQNA